MWIPLQLWGPHGCFESSSSNQKHLSGRSFDIFPDNVLNQRIWDNWLHWSQTRAVCWVAVCPCMQILFYNHSQMGDEIEFLTLICRTLILTSRVLGKGPGWVHPPRVFSNTLFSQQNMVEELCPKTTTTGQGWKVETGLDQILPLHPLNIFKNWALEWIRNRSRHISRCKPLPNFCLNNLVF